MRRQCELLGVNRNRLEVVEGHRLSAEDAELCELIDRIHLEAPAFGARKIRELLEREHGRKVGRGRVRRLMRLMGVRAVYRRPRTSLPGNGAEHRVYPYLLRERQVVKPDEAWCADITYIPMGRGFAYLVVIMDWRTRAVLAWEISNTLDTSRHFPDSWRMDRPALMGHWWMSWPRRLRQLGPPPPEGLH